MIDWINDRIADRNAETQMKFKKQSHQSYANADLNVKVCPECRDGWEYDYRSLSMTAKKVEYYGNWWNLKRGKKIELCPKCKAHNE